MSSLVLPLADPLATLETVGGKGTSLAKMAQSGLPVPDGFHITTDVYWQFVAVSDLQPMILAALRGVDMDDPSSLERVSAQISRCFIDSPLPPEIAGLIASAYQALSAAHNDGGDIPVAVRSSATAEDLPEASFAGQQETYLNVRGAPAVLDAVKNCWASLWTARAIAYRARQGIAPDTIALAVVVQELVCAEASGVLFTANPVNGKRSEMMITAAWGLGEAIVGGTVTPDTLMIDKATGRVLHRKTSRKQVMTVRTGTGTSEQIVPRRLQKARVLRDSQAAELSIIGAGIDKLYGMPMDIEWTLAKGKFAIVQARPVTSLPELPLEWVRAHPKALLARGSFAEFVPDPVSPLFATLALPIAQSETQKMMEGIVGAAPGTYLFDVVNGYVYAGIVLTPKLTAKLLVLSTIKAGQLLRNAMTRWTAVRANLRDTIHRWQRDLSSLTAPELLQGVRELFDATALYYTVGQSGPIASAPFSEIIFSRFYAALIKQKQDPAATIFLLGLETTPLRAEKSLYDLTMRVKEQPELAKHLLKQSTEAICAALQADPVPAPFAGEFARRFAAHLAEFGHTIYDLDFAKPLPADDPTPLVEAIKAYLEGKGGSPYERQNAQVERSQQAEQAILRRLDPFRRKWFSQLLRWAQRCSPDRENCIAELGLGYPLIRKLLGELGRRLVVAGAISDPKEIYWLEAQEADNLAAALEKGKALPSFGDKIEQRRSYWQRVRGVIPPVTLPEKSWMSRLLAHDNPEGNLLKGYGASAGKVTARACVLRGPEDFGQMSPGDVIVSVTTTPAWTPLFAMASGVVTDIGGPLSHSSIVAREYGIPAVMATGVASKRIRHGQMITVDGTRGTVMLLSGEQPGSPGATGEPGKGQSDWRLPKGSYAAVRNNIVELMAAPLSPLFATLGLSAINTSLHRWMDSFGMAGIMPKEIVFVVNQYAYNNGSLSARSFLKVVFGAGSIMKKMFSGAVERWTEAARPRYQQAVTDWQERPWRSFGSLDLVTAAHSLTETAIDAYSALISGVIPAAWITEALFTRIYNTLIKRRGDPAAPAFLLGSNSLPIQAEKSLYRLAEWAGEQPLLAQFLQETATARLVDACSQDQSPDEVPETLWGAWRERWQEHLHRYGSAIYDLDFVHALPLDDPSPLLDTLKLYLRGDGMNPFTRQEESAQQREQATRAVLERVSGLRLRWFRQSLERAQKYARMREDGLAEIGLAYPLIRKMLRELGGRFVQNGILGTSEDIFWLTQGEVTGSAIRLDAGQPVSAMESVIQERKVEHQAALRVTPPVALPQMKLFGKDSSSRKSSRWGGKGDRIKGVATSPGKVTGVARVLHGPEDFGQFSPGEVLVAAITTPAWTPLFAKALAVVTDIGGPLSHGSIVAREYAIPAVLGTGDATRRIRSGQTVTVDGSAGTVILAEDGREPGQ